MDFPKSSPIANKFDFVPETGSTNADLLAAAENLPDFSVLVAGFQSAGKGRSGRQWLAPAGSSLFVSVLLKPSGLSVNQFSWLPLLAGLAMTKTVAQFVTDGSVSLKWPNDVLVGENKISGVLSELLADQSGVVIGAGLNILQSQDQLPIANATSLALAGANEVKLDDALAEYLKNLRELYEVFVEAGADVVGSGIRQQVIATCSSLNRAGNKRVRVILPGGAEIVGEAVDIDDTGRLVVLADGAKEIVAVAAGDIVHLRHN